MTLILCYILFALMVAVGADYLRPYAPLLRPVPICGCCGCCGARRWRVTT